MNLGTDEFKQKNRSRAIQITDIAIDKVPRTHIAGFDTKQKMFMHNHPSTGTFSGEDFKMFCYHSSLYMMSVVGNDSNIYMLIKTFEFNVEKAMTDYIQLAMKYYNEGHRNNNGTLAIKEILKNANKYGLLYKKGRKSI